MISVRNAYCGIQEFYSVEEAEAFCALVRYKSLYSGTQAHILAYYLYTEWRRGAGRAYEAKAQEAARRENMRELAAIKAELAAMQRDYAAQHVKAAATSSPALKYNSNQPRVPGGNENGGQWTSGGGEGGGINLFSLIPGFNILSGLFTGIGDWLTGIFPADGIGEQSFGFAPDGTEIDAAQSGLFRSGRINLIEEVEGHAYQDHVGKSDEYLIREVYKKQLEVLNKLRPPSEDGYRQSTFSSLEQANKLVNATVYHPQAREKLLAVSSGASIKQVFRVLYDQPTGIEAYASGLSSRIQIRDTYGVNVVLHHSQNLPRGFFVTTAFPGNRR